MAGIIRFIRCLDCRPVSFLPFPGHLDHLRAVQLHLDQLSFGGVIRNVDRAPDSCGCGVGGNGSSGIPRGVLHHAGNSQAFGQGEENAGSPVLEGPRGLKKLELEGQVRPFVGSTDNWSPALAQRDGLDFFREPEPFAVPPDGMVAPFQVFLGEESRMFYLEEAAAGAPESFFTDWKKPLAGKTGILHTPDYRGLFQG